MPEDPRAPRHPSDIPSSRATSGATSSGPPGNTPYTPGPTPPTPSGNWHTRNIVIGAIATIVASTTVYYLTQYVNLRKGDSESSYTIRKENTISAWKRYVAVSNIYYKAIQTVSRNTSAGADCDLDCLFSKLEKNIADMFEETNIFIKDAEVIIKDKSLDKTLVSMVKRRVKREKESIANTNSFIKTLKAIANGNLKQEEKNKKILSSLSETWQYTSSLLEIGATEIEDLSKTLAETYGTSFDPMEVMIFSDYKKGKFNLDTTSRHHHRDSLVAAKNIDPKKLIGSWYDEGNKLELKKDGTLSYSMASGSEGSGVWKIDDDLLRLDAVEKTSKLKSIYFFGLYNLDADSFTIRLTSAPYDIYTFRREKE